MTSLSFQIKPGTFPPSLRVLVISHAKSVQLTAGALRSLPNLQRFHLLSIESITLDEDSMSLASSARTNVTLERVDFLSVSPAAFSDWGRPGCGITLRNIAQCSIAGNAFRSVTPIPAVTLEHVASLSLAPASLAANITVLSVTNVTVTRCLPGTFGGRLRSLSLSSVSLHRAERGCLSADSWETLRIDSSQLGYITSGSFSGDIGEVLLRDSSVRYVDGGGIDLNVTRFTAVTTHFGELRPEALRVTASRSISLQSCTVGTLRRDAFRCLRLEGDDRESISVQRLRVDRADPGALRFAGLPISGNDADGDDDVDHGDEDANTTSEAGDSVGRVVLTELDFGMPCECGARERANRLLLSNEEDHLHAFHNREHPLLQSVLSAHCADAENENTSTLAEFEQRWCGGRMAPSARQAEPRWRYYTAVGVPLILLLVMTVAALLRQRQRTRTRQRRTSSQSRTCSVASKEVWVIPSTRSSVASVVRDSVTADQGIPPDTTAAGGAITAIIGGRVPPTQRRLQRGKQLRADVGVH